MKENEGLTVKGRVERARAVRANMIYRACVCVCVCVCERRRAKCEKGRGAAVESNRADVIALVRCHVTPAGHRVPAFRVGSNSIRST